MSSQVMSEPKSMMVEPYYGQFSSSMQSSTIAAATAAAAAYVSASPEYTDGPLISSHSTVSVGHSPTDEIDISATRQDHRAAPQPGIHISSGGNGLDPEPNDGTIAGLLKAAMVSSNRTVLAPGHPEYPSASTSTTSFSPQLPSEAAIRKRCHASSSTSSETLATGTHRKRACLAEDKLNKQPTSLDGLSRSASFSSGQETSNINTTAILFRKTRSTAKKHTRPPMAKLYDSLNLSPEQFVLLQAAAKQFMLHPAYPERRNCIGNRGSSDNDVTRLRLFNNVKEFLESGAGDRFFGPFASTAPLRHSKDRKRYVWPEDVQQIVMLVTPLLRRVLTNERQRVYALESRKQSAKREKDMPGTESGFMSFSPQQTSVDSGNSASPQLVEWVQGILGSKQFDHATNDAHIGDLQPKVSKVSPSTSHFDFNWTLSGSKTSSTSRIIDFKSNFPSPRLSITIVFRDRVLGQVDVDYTCKSAAELETEFAYQTSYNVLLDNIRSLAVHLISRRNALPSRQGSTASTKGNAIDEITELRQLDDTFLLEHGREQGSEESAKEFNVSTIANCGSNGNSELGGCSEPGPDTSNGLSTAEDMATSLRDSFLQHIVVESSNEAATSQAVKEDDIREMHESDSNSMAFQFTSSSEPPEDRRPRGFSLDKDSSHALYSPPTAERRNQECLLEKRVDSSQASDEGHYESKKPAGVSGRVAVDDIIIEQLSALCLFDSPGGQPVRRTIKTEKDWDELRREVATKDKARTESEDSEGVDSEREEEFDEVAFMAKSMSLVVTLFAKVSLRSD